MADENISNELLTEMAEAGVVYGHKKSKTHPRMKPFISGIKNEIELIDPQATLTGIERAVQVIKEVRLKSGLILFAGTGPAAKQIVKDFAVELKMPYVVSRWLGGTLTNFKIINARIKYYEDLKAKIAKGELGKYTKKEQLGFEKEIKKMKEFFEGLVPLDRLPGLLFVVDVDLHSTAVREAHIAKIPIVAVIDTDDDPASVDYPIFANDHGKSSIEWVINKIREGIKVQRSESTNTSESTNKSEKIL